MDVQAFYARELVSTRIIAASPQRLYQAFIRGEELARWWGPAGFTNTNHVFEPRPGGRWHLTMHGPDGTSYANELTFLQLDENRRIVLDHSPEPHFLLTAEIERLSDGAKITFRQLFDTADVCTALRAICVPANEQNLDRLTAVVTAGA
jgi:uncharacterized protein YndB with AHSA1/START domain